MRNQFLLSALFVLALLGGVLAKKAENKPSASSTSPPNTESSSIVYPTQSNDDGPNTTTSTTTTTTTTTTPASKTTSTTTPASDTTTTSTTSSPIITTTPPPSIPQPGTWNTTYSNKTVACIVARMSIAMKIHYQAKNGSTSKNATIDFSVPKSAISSGNCGSTNQTMKLEWNITKNASAHVTFTFLKNNTEYILANVASSIPSLAFPNITVNESTVELFANFSHLPIPVNQSYVCLEGIYNNLTSPAYPKDFSFINLTNVQFQAFASITNYTFGQVVDCAAIPYVTPDIVPIAVGVSLAALVAVVLIAYVIGRRRSAASGYLSM